MSQLIRLRLNNIRVPLTDERELAEIISKRLRLAPDQLQELQLLRRTVDARHKNNILLVYHVSFALPAAKSKFVERLLREQKDLSLYQQPALPELVAGTEPRTGEMIVIGAGPAGLLAALTLAQAGYKPLLLERGKALAERVADVDSFWRTGIFNPESNVQFGAGGAGTFSDGKLTTRVNDPVMGFILQQFVAAGAPSNILYEHKPHVGTDELRKLVTGLLKQIEELGGKVCFGTQVTELEWQEGRITGVVTQQGMHIPASAVVLACGHSARDTYQLLVEHGVAVEAKAFAIGVRIEHKQELIDQAQYGKFAQHPKLGAADYALVHHDAATGRTAYSFCMCPGGQVVAAASEAGGVVTNGMSQYKRDSGLANSALAVNVTPADFAAHPLGGVEFQRHYERLAYAAAGSNYHAPAQNIKSFLQGSTPALQVGFEPTYRPGLTPVALSEVLPAYVTATLGRGIEAFGRRLQGFATDGMLTGVETRTSAPVRIVRGPNGESVSHRNLYPTGEGAGYAGGIMSAALDGYHQAVHIIERFRPQ